MPNVVDELDFEFLCAGWTAPYHSWRNPVESVMVILKKEVAKCNSLTQLRKIAEETTSWLELNVTFSCLHFKEEQLKLPVKWLQLRNSVSLDCNYSC